MSKKPKISLIITTYNSASVLEPCLKSIRGQSFKDFELIVVDESSKDATQKIAKKYADKLIIEGKERCQKRNIGARHSLADYLFFIDSDMELSRDILNEIKDELSPNTLVMIPEISFGQGFWTKCKTFERATYVGGNIAQIPRVYPKKMFMQVNGFDEKVLGAEDFDLFFKIKKANKNIRAKEIKSIIFHNEGRLRYGQILKRMRTYSKSFAEYKQRYPDVFSKQFSISRYLKNWKHFIKHPVLTFGFCLMKGGEAAVALYSMRKY